MKRTLFPVLAISAAVIAVAGCGSSNKSSTSSGNAAAPASTAPAAGKGEKIAAKDTKLGKILVDEDGRTLYLFEADKSTQSTCAGTCSQAWPPVTTSGKPVAEQGAEMSKLGTTMRSDGKTQVTYGGHPLYYYAEDEKAGDTNGQGSKEFGAEWYVLGPTGGKVEKGESESSDSSDSSDSGNSSSSGGGYKAY
jgi:predicted lipoprotein with Yx(FWY)xxD motif